MSTKKEEIIFSCNDIMAKPVRRCFKKQEGGTYKVGKMCNPIGSAKKFASGKVDRKLEVVKKRKLQIMPKRKLLIEDSGPKPRTAAQKAASRKSSAAYRARKKAAGGK